MLLLIALLLLIPLGGTIVGWLRPVRQPLMAF